jgi:methylmalonyl-CoA/ethylmalonyl-CoA epimerase
MTGVLHQVAQHAPDLDASVGFYRDVMGLPLIARFDPPGLVFLKAGDTRLLLEGAAPPALIYLRVGDLFTEYERLRAAGVTLQTDPHVIYRDTDGTFGPPAEEWMAFVRDPAGNLVGLSERRPLS